MAKTVTSNTGLTTTTVNSTDYLKVPYKVTVTSTNSFDVDVDQVIDKPHADVTLDSTVTPTLTTFTAGGGQLDQLGRSEQEFRW